MIVRFQRVQKFFQFKIIVPVILLILAGISYGFIIPSLGYYGDDWSMAWLAYQSHHLELFFTGNRPALGTYFDILTRALGPAPWHWQVLAFVFH